METEALPDDEIIKPLPVPQARWERLLYALVVTVLPILCFCVSSLYKPQHQNEPWSSEGTFADYARILLAPDIAWVFFPFLIYASTCLVLLLIAPQRFASRFAVRFGIYTGVAIGLQYTFLVLSSHSIARIAGLVSAAGLIVLKVIYTKIKPKREIGSFILFCLLILVLISPLVIFMMVFLGLSFDLSSMSTFFSLMGDVVLLGLSTAAPILYLLIMSITSSHLSKSYAIHLNSRSGWQIAGLLGWVTSYGIVWRFAILQTINYYQSLPVSPPMVCYVATASARGHQRVVHARLVQTPDGALLVTQQLQRLKCAELALMALMPRFHASLRRFYNWMGPRLARRLTHPLLADVAYLALKPAEWVATLALKAIIPDIDVYVRRFYSGE